MPRPESINDLPDIDRYASIASVQMGQVLNNVRLMRIVTDLTEAVQELGGRSTGSSYVTFERPKSEEELADALKTAQRGWDINNERYAAIAAAEINDTVLDPPFKEYEGYGLRRHAEAEGYPILDTIAEKAKA